MRGFLLWTRVAWWAMLLGLIELIRWPGESRHGRAAAGSVLLLLATGGTLALLHPVGPLAPRPAVAPIMRGPAIVRGSGLPLECTSPLAPILIAATPEPAFSGSAPYLAATPVPAETAAPASISWSTGDDSACSCVTSTIGVAEDGVAPYPCTPACGTEISSGVPVTMPSQIVDVPLVQCSLHAILLPLAQAGVHTSYALTESTLSMARGSMLMEQPTPAPFAGPGSPQS